MQLDLFGSPPAVTTTAIYPNRVRDLERVERCLGLTELGGPRIFRTRFGTLFATEYLRLILGDHGPYCEFNRDQIVCELRRKFGRPPPPDAYYDWLEPVDGSGVKVYAQLRNVKHLPNPPAGGFRGNRAEGYADYVPGMIYVSPWELFVDAP